jgi:TRAP-type uncharacterized transport system substrate-binding protein
MGANKLYDILELSKMPIDQLRDLAGERFNIDANAMQKQAIVYAILDKQQKPSELHCRDRYAVADQITEMMQKKVLTVLLVMFAFGSGSCATMEPKSKALRRSVRIQQQEIQYEHCTNAREDWMRTYRHGWNAPKKMTRIPFTQLYIY